MYQFVYADGGRSKYFGAKHVGDCAVRAICNASGKDYLEVYKALAKIEKETQKKPSSPRDGVHKSTDKKYIEEVLGWVWVPTMRIGGGCTTHLDPDELPWDNIIVEVSGHLTNTRAGVLYDTYDCTREGTRCVYGYWRAPTEAEALAREVAKRKKAEAERIQKAHAKRIARLEEAVRKAKRELAKELKAMQKELKALE